MRRLIAINAALWSLVVCVHAQDVAFKAHYSPASAFSVPARKRDAPAQTFPIALKGGSECKPAPTY